MITAESPVPVHPKRSGVRLDYSYSLPLTEFHYFHFHFIFTSATPHPHLTHGPTNFMGIFNVWLSAICNLLSLAKLVRIVCMC